MAGYFVERKVLTCFLHILAKPDGRREIRNTINKILETDEVSDFGEPYRGARDDLSIWKRRALEAEAKALELDLLVDRLSNAINEANGPVRMGEPLLEKKKTRSVRND